MTTPLLVTSEELLYNVLSKHANESTVFAIDGMYGVGKSSLARRIGTWFDCRVVECDSFIQKNHGHLPYPAILDLENLRCAIAAATVQTRPVVVDSILLRSVLNALRVEQAFHVYVRRIPIDSRDDHAKMFDDNRTEAELIAEISEVARCAEIADDYPLLERQLVRYHKQTLPHQRADVLYELHF